jgi:nucleotide-binding universal stress UspA family protein
VPDTIVVPLDGSPYAERALALAAAISGKTGAEVVVLTARQGGVVVEPKRYLTEAARASGIANMRPVVIEDRPAARAIVEVVGEARDPVVCMTTHARGGAGHALFGSLAEETLRQAGVAMLLVGPRTPAGLVADLEHLVVCLDGSELSSAILPLAAAWAPALEVDVTLLTVVDPGAQAAHPPLGDVSVPTTLERCAHELELACGAVAWTVLTDRHAADAIVEFAARRPGTLLALTSHGRTGLARITVGSVTMGVVRDATCPILTIRPAALEPGG